MREKLKILVADDERSTLTLLDKQLRKWGHEVILAANGTEAWDLLSVNRAGIDVAILDWNMPGMTGPEICINHNDPRTSQFIYKIILSGIMTRAQIFEALHSGANDVLEKPCDVSLLRSRLEVASAIVKEKRILENIARTMQTHAREMEELAEERTQQLVQAEKLSTLGVMAAGVAHEINNPMSFISGNTQALERYWQDVEPLLRSSAERASDDGKLDFFIEEMPQMLSDIMKGVHRVTKITNSLRRYSGSASQGGQRIPFDINDCVQQAVGLCSSQLGKDVSTKLLLEEELPQAFGNDLELEQVFVNLIINANHAMTECAEKVLSFKTSREEKAILVSIADTGRGISEDVMKTLWDPFVTTKAPGVGTGLGLSISCGIVRNHGGSMRAYNQEMGGACFEVRLPIRERS